MSLIEKLRIALSVCFILTTAGAISIRAQTGADHSSTEKVARTTAPAKTAGDDTLEANTGASKSNDVAVAATSRAKAGTSSGTEAPAQPAPTDKWQFQVTPYFWLESLHGNAGVGNRTTHVDQSFSDLFHDLDFFIMGAFEARKGKLVSLTTIEYTDISDEKATPGPLFSSAKANFKQFIFDSEVGYRLYDDPDKGASVDVLGGIRVWHVSTDLTFRAGILPTIDLQGTRNWVDAVAGLRGKAAVSKKVFVTGKFDLGGGGSKFTWQIFGGAGYNVTPKIALIGGYRVLDVNYNKNGFLYDMNQRGPILGVGFKF